MNQRFGVERKPRHGSRNPAIHGKPVRRLSRRAMRAHVYGGDEEYKAEMSCSWITRSPSFTACRYHDARVGNEERGAYELGQLLRHAAPRAGRRNGVDVYRRSGFLPGKLPVPIVRFEYFRPVYGHIAGYFFQERFVPGGIVSAVHREHDGLPAELPQVLDEFQHALHPRSTGRGKVIGDDEDGFHPLLKGCEGKYGRGSRNPASSNPRRRRRQDSHTPHATSSRW